MVVFSYCSSENCLGTPQEGIKLQLRCLGNGACPAPAKHPDTNFRTLNSMHTTGSLIVSDDHSPLPESFASYGSVQKKTVVKARAAA